MRWRGPWRGFGRMDTPEVTVIAATRLEAWAVRRALRHGRIIEAGVGLRRLRVKDLGEPVVSCGLAGAVRPGLPTGSVVIPKRVLRTDGEWVTCDPFLVDLLVAAARESWAERGCAAVDMETGLLTAPRIAAVRVILDTPERDLSEVWRRPALAFVRPESWREALWLLREAPRCAGRAAAVVAAGLGSYARAPGRPDGAAAAEGG